MSADAKRVRLLEDEVAMLRDCLERGVTIAAQEHAQNVVELRMLRREKDSLKEQLQHTTTELSGDVYLAFSEVKRLSATNVDLLRSLELKCEEVSDLKHKLGCLNDIYLQTSEKLEEAEQRCNSVRHKCVDQHVLICSLRRVIANHHEKNWVADEQDWQALHDKEEAEQAAADAASQDMLENNIPEGLALLLSGKSRTSIPLPSLLNSGKGALGSAPGGVDPAGGSGSGTSVPQPLRPVAAHRIFEGKQHAAPEKSRRHQRGPEAIRSI